MLSQPDFIAQICLALDSKLQSKHQVGGGALIGGFDLLWCALPTKHVMRVDSHSFPSWCRKRKNTFGHQEK
jgi:hypothetical protein